MNGGQATCRAPIRWRSTRTKPGWRASVRVASNSATAASPRGISDSTGPDCRDAVDHGDGYADVEAHRLERGAGQRTEFVVPSLVRRGVDEAAGSPTSASASAATASRFTSSPVASSTWNRVPNAS